jgi:outer membrane lipoprotein SlyB
MVLFKSISFVLGLALCAVMAEANAQQFDQRVYTNGMQMQQVQTGRVIAVRSVTLHVARSSSLGNYVGTGAGAAVGAAIGSNVGNNPVAKTTAQVVLGAVGAYAGNAVADRMNSSDEEAQEIVISLDPPVQYGSSQTVAITQAGSSIQTGMKVYLIGVSSGTVRVVPM